MLIAAPSEFRCDKSTTGFHFAPRLSFTDPKIRAENATFNGILIGSVAMTEILVSRFDAVSGPGTGARRNCIKPGN